MTNKLTELVKNTSTFFQKFALELYLENLRHKYFPDVAHAFQILKHLANLLEKQSTDIFETMEQSMQFLNAQNLNTDQEHAVLKAIKNYVQLAVWRRLPSYNPEFETTYLPFFTQLEEIALQKKLDKNITEEDAKESAHKVVQKQLLLLSEEINGLPTEKRIKMLSTLVRTLAQYERLTAPPKPAKTKTVNPATMKQESNNPKFTATEKNNGAPAETSTPSVENPLVMPTPQPSLHPDLSNEQSRAA